MSEGEQGSRKPGLYLGDVDLTAMALDVREGDGQQVPWGLVRGELQVQVNPERVTLTIPSEMALQLIADGVLDLAGGEVELALPGYEPEPLSVVGVQLRRGPRGTLVALELGQPQPSAD